MGNGQLIMRQLLLDNRAGDHHAAFQDIVDEVAEHSNASYFITKSVRPTAKIVLYSVEPVGTSPFPVAAMKAVIVWTASVGLSVRFG